MNFLIPIISAVLYRLDGWGDGDPFVNVWPLKYIKGHGINYSRYAIGFVAWAFTGQWIYATTYAIAVSIPYKEGGWLEKIFGPFKWLVIGALFGGASLSWGNALWVGMIAFVTRYFEVDHSVWEFFVMGGLGTLVFSWK